MRGTNYTDTKAQTSLYISSQIYKIQNWNVGPRQGPVAMECARLPGFTAQLSRKVGIHAPGMKPYVGQILTSSNCYVTFNNKLFLC